ncbi:MAG: hypothetical protein ABR608_11585 [Pseudonocardiaceae bacterium]
MDCLVLLTLQGTGTAPILQFDPDVVQAGRVATLLGSSFAPLRSVTITMPESATFFDSVTHSGQTITPTQSEEQVHDESPRYPTGRPAPAKSLPASR